MRPLLFAARSFWIGFSCRNPPFCITLLSGRVPLGHVFTFCGHVPVLIENALEAAQGPGLFQTTFLRDHGLNEGTGIHKFFNHSHRFIACCGVGIKFWMRHLNHGVIYRQLNKGHRPLTIPPLVDLLEGQ